MIQRHDAGHLSQRRPGLAAGRRVQIDANRTVWGRLPENQAGVAVTAVHTERQSHGAVERRRAPLIRSEAELGRRLEAERSRDGQLVHGAAFTAAPP